MASRHEAVWRLSKPGLRIRGIIPRQLVASCPPVLEVGNATWQTTVNSSHRILTPEWWSLEWVPTPHR